MNVIKTGPSAQAREIARYLIAYEALNKDHTGTARPAVVQVCEKLRRPLSTLTGAAGFRSLLVRALTLTKRTAPELDAVQVHDDGTLEGLTCTATEPGALLLIAQLLGLLMAFVGETLTMSLLYDIWPDLLGVNLNSEEED